MGEPGGSGRRSGRVTRFPLGMAYYRGASFLVSMLREDCNWVRNVRAAAGVAVLRHRRPCSVRLIEVPVEERAPIIKPWPRLSVGTFSTGESSPSEMTGNWGPHGVHVAALTTPLRT
jgi:hypothetical protein